MTSITAAAIVAMIPKELLARFLVLIFERLAQSTEWTVDDEIVKILKESLEVPK